MKIRIYKNLPRSIYILATSKLLSSVANFAIPFLSLILTSNLDISTRNSGIIISIAYLCFIPGVWVGGFLADIFDKRWLNLYFSLLASVSIILFIICSDIYLKIIFISLFNFAFSARKPIFNSLVANYCNQIEIRYAYSLLYIATNLGIFLGSPVGGHLLGKHSNYLLAVDGFTTALSGILILFCTKTTTKNIKDVEKNNKLAFMNELCTKHSNVLMFVFLFFLLNLCYSQYTFSLPLYLKVILSDKGSEYYGYLLSVNAIIVVLFTTQITRLTEKSNALICISTGGFLLGAGFGLYYFSTSSILSLIIPTVIWTLGEILILLYFNIYISKKLPSKDLGKSFGIFSSISYVGIYIGPVVFGIIIDTFSIKLVWVVVAITCFIASTSMMLLSRQD